MINLTLRAGYQHVSKMPNQRLFVVRIDDYAWLVPYVENDKEIFLKTIIPSRKATKKFLGGLYDQN